MRCEAPVGAAALEKIRAPLLELGAVLVDPPVIQPLNLMLDVAGEAMRARLFIVQDEGGREACLRPDFTVAVARDHIRSGAATGRYRYEGRAFRVAPPGLGEVHPEEFLQIGAEVFGEAATPQADAAIAVAAWQAAAAGGRRDLTMRVGDTALFGAFLGAIGVEAPLAARLARAIGRPRQLAGLIERGAGRVKGIGWDSLTRAEAISSVEETWARKGLTPIGGRTAAEIAARLQTRARESAAPRLDGEQKAAITAYLALEGETGAVLDRAEALAGKPLEAARKAWEERAALLSAAGVTPVVMATAFGRAFGYYDGFLFEVTSGALGPDAPLAAGGRYDGLTQRLGGGACTAVGCMVRPARALAEGGQ